MSAIDPNDRLRNEFDRWAEAGKGEGMEREHLPIVLPVLDRMNLASDENVLDLGCGSGWLSALLSEQLPEGRVVGVDVSDAMIRLARRRYVDVENVMFCVGQADRIPWDASFFTSAISVESAYYWPDPGAGLREIFRVLREGGTVWLLINYYRDNPHSQQWGTVFEIPTQLLSSEEWSNLFREAGFGDVRTSRIPDPTPVSEPYEGRWFRDADQLRAFRAEGALLIQGTKPRY